MRIRRQLVGNPRFGVERIRIVRKQLCFLRTCRREKLLEVYQHVRIAAGDRSFVAINKSICSSNNIYLNAALSFIPTIVGAPATLSSLLSKTSTTSRKSTAPSPLTSEAGVARPECVYD